MPDRTMGSQATVTPTEASIILGISRRQIRSLVDEGLIRTEGKAAPDGKRLVKDDVTGLIGLKKRNRDRATALQALALAKRLERELLEIKSLLRMDGIALGLEKEEVIGFYAYVEELTAHGVIKLEDINPLMKKLMNVDEHYLKLVERYVAESEPWTIFMRLAQKLQELVTEDKDKALASTIRINIRNAAFVYAKANHTGSMKKYDFRFDEEKIAQRMLNVILSPDPTETIRRRCVRRTARTPSSG